MHLPKLRPREKSMFTIKWGQRVKDLFSSAEETYMRYRLICWLKQLEVNIAWLLHSQSTLLVLQSDPTLKPSCATGGMLSLSLKKKNLCTEEGTSFLPIYLSSLSHMVTEGVISEHRWQPGVKTFKSMSCLS